jgi:hypothetical protein
MNSTMPSPAEKCPWVAAVTVIETATRPMPSLTRLSLSRIARSRTGASLRPITVVALTGSVGASTAPRTNADAPLSAATSPQAMPPTAKIVVAVRPNARNRISRQLASTSNGGI